MIINLSHQKGGTGKSTLAYNLTRAFHIMGYKVKLLDLDSQNTCVNINELREEELDYIVNIEHKEDLIEEINTHNEDEIIIIDSGGFDSNITRLAIQGADINLTPVADKVTEVLAVTKKYSLILEDLAKETNDDIRTYILLNKIHIFATDFKHIENNIAHQERMNLVMRKKVVKNKEVEIPLIIRDRGIYDKSLIEGKTVQEANDLKGHEAASDEMEKLAKALIEIDKKDNK